MMHGNNYPEGYHVMNRSGVESGQNRTFRMGLLASTACAALLMCEAPARAACTPNAGNGITATCTGTTVNQNGVNGYGVGSETNLNVTVAQGATVNGTANGIAFDTGTVTNSGTISANSAVAVGILAGTSASVANSGAISANGGGGAGIFAGTSAAVTNSGTIAANGNNGTGIFAHTGAVVTNSGIISANGQIGTGIFSLSSTAVINSGTISANGDTGTGVRAGTSAAVTNSGTISANGDGGTGIQADVGAVVTNSGLISADGLNGFGILTNGSTNVTNSGTISANGEFGVGIFTRAGAVVNNSGTISSDADFGRSIQAGTSAVVTNSGAILANGAFGVGIQAATFAAVTNSGTISANGNGGTAIQAIADATVSNSGTISANGRFGVGIGSDAGVFVINSGTISANGQFGVGITADTTGNVTNSGTIIGGGGTAIQFNANGTPASDTLTVLPGARFGGLVDFGGGADRVNFGPGSWILDTANFDKALSTVTTSGNPYVVTPNQIVVADLSGFGAQNRAIMDITGWIGSVLPDAPVYAPGAGSGVTSFAAADTASSPFAAFDDFPAEATNALGYAKAPAFKNASVGYADGQAVWAKAFGGQRQQDSSGALIGGTTTGYGGAVGYERMVMPDLRLGALIGGSTNQTNLYLNAGSTKTDTVFGGAYGRRNWGGTFLDLAVIGGNLDNSNIRNIGGGLAFATANASYGGWFVMPSMMLGQRIDINRSGLTVTPAVKVRYVAARFDGYSESGAGVANLTVASRDFQAFEERAEITLANTSTLANGSRVTARVTGGMLGQQRTGGGEVNVALIGQNFIATTPDRSSVAGGYGSAGLDWQIGNVTLFSAGEATYTNDAARTYAGKGGVKVSW